MAQYIALLPEIEVNGETVLSIVDGMTSLRKAAMEILKENGINNPQPGFWYNQQDWLDAFREISERTGYAVLRKIGNKIPENAQWPADIDSIHKGLISIDIAYHINHRIRGEVMYNPETGSMIEGIAHYRYEKIDDTSAKVICDNPYPCTFDKGIIESVAEKYSRQGDKVRVFHEDTGCRTNGGDSCTYIAEW